MKRDNCIDSFFVARGMATRPEPGEIKLQHVFQMPWDILHAVSKVLYRWQSRTVSRRELAEFDDRMLQDIGIDRTDALREVEKPFWRE